MKILKIKTLKPGWTDKDEVLVHAMFQVLCDFVEKEKPEKIIDWEYDKTHSKIWKEIQFLYRWWKKVRPKRKDPIFEVDGPEHGYEETPEEQIKKRSCTLKFIFKNSRHEKLWNKKCRESRRWELNCNKEDNQMMKRLIDVRKYLWT